MSRRSRATRSRMRLSSSSSFGARRSFRSSCSRSFPAIEVARHHLRARRAALMRMLSRRSAAWRSGACGLHAGEVEAEAARTLSSGRDYLQVKKRLREETAAPPRATLRAVNGALSTLRKAATKTRKDSFPPPGKGRPYVTGASFLVKAKRRGAWRKQVANTTAALARQGHQLEMSGPWPPYHFVSR